MGRAASSALVLATLLACERGAADAGIAPTAAPAPASQAQPLRQVASEGWSTLAKLDGRVPVPLIPMMANHQKQNMREHLEAVQQVVEGLSRGDFAAVEAAARKMGYSEETGAMCAHMGEGAAGFTEQALRFHHTADTIAAAAHRRDKPAALKALAATLQTCTGCHAVYRQAVVADATTASRP